MKFRFVAAALAASCTFAAHAEPVVLKVAHFLPPMAAAHTKFIVPWCDKLEKESAGDIKCQLYPAMQLGGTPPQLLNQVRDGVADVVWTLPGYTPGRFPVSEVFELPFMGTTPEATSRALWDFVQANAMSEFKGMQPLATWVPGPYQLHLRDKQVNTLDDLKGMKVRAPSRLGNKLIAALGATPVGMPVPQMGESLSKGVIDAAIVPWEVVPATKTHELVKFHAETTAGARTMSMATMILAMNKKKYDSLTPAQKKVMDDNSGRETSAWIASVFVEADKAGRAAAEKQGNTIYALSAEELGRWQAAAKPVEEEWIKEVSDKGMDGRKLVDEASALIQKYSK